MKFYIGIILMGCISLFIMIRDLMKLQAEVKRKVEQRDVKPIKEEHNKDANVLNELLVLMLSQRNKINKLELQYSELKNQHEELHQKFDDIKMHNISNKHYSELRPTIYESPKSNPYYVSSEDKGSRKMYASIKYGSSNRPK